MHESVWSVGEMSSHASLFATWLLEIGHRGVFAHVVGLLQGLQRSHSLTTFCFSQMHTTGYVLLVYGSKALKHTFLPFGSR